MRPRGVAALAALALPAAAAAQAEHRALATCDRTGVTLESVAVGGDLSGVRTFHQGAVTLFAIDQVEPACCSYGVAIVMPAPPQDDEPVGMTCWAKWGYAGVDLRRARARYTPAEGLTLTIPTREYVPETGGSTVGSPMRLRIDVGRGRIVDLDPPRR